MLFRQFLRSETGCASYLVGCVEEGKAVAVDVLPAFTVPIREMLVVSGMRLVAVIESHTHSDHLSAAHELSARTGAPLVAHASAPIPFPFHPVREGDTLDLGMVQLHVWETPGHTPDSVALLLTDFARADEPCLVLSGDTLMAGGVGSPEPLGGVDPAAAASDLFDSLRRLLSLPDFVAVYPSHTVTAAAHHTLSTWPATTIGFERRYNPALSSRSRDEFIAAILGGEPGSSDASGRGGQVSGRGAGGAGDDRPPRAATGA